MQNDLDAEDFSGMLANRDAAAEQFKAQVNALSLDPHPEAIQWLQTLLHNLADQIPGGSALLTLPEDTAPLTSVDLAELQKTEHRILYLDFLYMLYYLENQETLAVAEYTEKFKAKLQRLQAFVHALAVG